MIGHLQYTEKNRDVEPIETKMENFTNINHQNCFKILENPAKFKTLYILYYLELGDD